MPQCRWSQSLGELEATHQEVWGTTDYVSKDEPTVFFGLYDLRDYIALWRHRGKAWVLWAGSDIRNIRSNFIFNDGKLLWLSQIFNKFNIGFNKILLYHVLNKAEHWCENEAEAWQLKDIGLQVSICPSFLGNIKKYKSCFRSGNKVYLSANRGRENEYGWGIIEDIAPFVPELEFHLYGSDWKKYSQNILAQGITWNDYRPNVFIHGRVPKEQMNREIKNMQCGLRMNKHDGFSEVTAKSILWGQYPICYLYNDKIPHFGGETGLMDSADGLQRLVKMLKQIPKKKQANKARNYYVKRLNSFPWNTKKY